MRFFIKNSIGWMILVAACLALGQGVATADSVGREIDDSVITTRIDTTFLFNERLSPFSIKVSTKAGVVTLVGGVPAVEEKQLAEDLARSVDGVKDVRNNITVLPATPSQAPKRGFKQKAEDLTVSAAVRAQLLYFSELRGLTITVKTENNITTLSGVVDTPEQKQRIGELANETKGVDSVINNLTVVPKKGVGSAGDVGRVISDEWIADRIRTRIILNRYISIRKLSVKVRSKECILTGTVDTPEQKELAGSIAENTPGVRVVRNDIRLRSENTPENGAPTAPKPEPKFTEPKVTSPDKPDKPEEPAPPHDMEMLDPTAPHTGAAPSVKEESLPSPAANDPAK